MIQTKSKLRNNNKRRTFIKKGGTKGNHPNNVYTQEYYSKDEVKHLLNLVKKNISTFREEIKSSKQMFNGEMNKILKNFIFCINYTYFFFFLSLTGLSISFITLLTPYIKTTKTRAKRLNPIKFLTSLGSSEISIPNKVKLCFLFLSIGMS